MTYEVEQKYRVHDLPGVECQLDAMGAQWAETVTQVDTYFSHPARDFAITDEALRIRRVGDDNVITFKGPKLDVTTKTRREIEISLAEGDKAADDMRQLLISVGFTPVKEVRKQRRLARLKWEGRPLEIALDNVDRVGTFVEVELLASESDLDAAKAAVGSLAKRLGLADSERRSYLELLLEADAGEQCHP